MNKIEKDPRVREMKEKKPLKSYKTLQRPIIGSFRNPPLMTLSIRLWLEF